MKEVWKDIEGFEGFYQVSNQGRIKSPNGFRTVSYTHDGYAKVRLIHNGIDKTFRIHRLVAEAFIPKIPGKDTVNHIDGNKKNNNAYNLEWANRHEQMKHAYNNGLKKPVHTNRKFTSEQVEQIRKEYVRHSKEFGTVALARKYGVNNSTIGNIVRGVYYA